MKDIIKIMLLTITVVSSYLVFAKGNLITFNIADNIENNNKSKSESSTKSNEIERAHKARDTINEKAEELHDKAVDAAKHPVEKEGIIDKAKDNIKDAGEAVKEKAEKAAENTREATKPVTDTIKNAAKKTIEKTKELMGSMSSEDTITGPVVLHELEKKDLTINGQSELNKVNIKNRMIINGASLINNSTIYDATLNGLTTINNTSITNLHTNNNAKINNSKISHINHAGSLELHNGQYDKIKTQSNFVKIDNSEVRSLLIQNDGETELRITGNSHVSNINVIINGAGNLKVFLDKASNRILVRKHIKCNSQIEYTVE